MYVCLTVFSSLVMFAFVIYETRGLAGHYRTMMNQLLSYLYGAVSIFYISKMSFPNFQNEISIVFFLNMNPVL